jgi:hypothetical protein
MELDKVLEAQGFGFELKGVPSAAFHSLHGMLSDNHFNFQLLLFLGLRAWKSVDLCGIC